MSRGRRPDTGAALKFGAGDTFAPPPGAPEPPSVLTDAAKVEWKRVVGLLEESAVLSQVDLAILSMYCQTYARWVEAERDVNERGLVVGLRANPAAKLSEALTKQLRGLITELGFTPAARRKVQGHGSGEDELDNFNRKKGA